jgi:hypothetical protein
MCRKMCHECPWKNDTKHNTNLIGSIIRWFKNGSRKTTEHRCHMISTDLWATTNENNICIGSKMTNENLGSSKEE